MVRFDVPPVSRVGPSLNSPFVSAVAVIPARYESSRLPGKALADIGGHPMIEHVYRRAAAAQSIASVIVVTDDERIHRAVQGFGGTSRMTSRSHQSGTDRIAEIAPALSADLSRCPGTCRDVVLFVAMSRDLPQSRITCRDASLLCRVARGLVAK